MKPNIFTIEIEECDGEEEYKSFLGLYNYKIYHEKTLLREGKLEYVIKINEVNAIVSCLNRELNGDTLFGDNE